MIPNEDFLVLSIQRGVLHSFSCLLAPNQRLVFIITKKRDNSGLQTFYMETERNHMLLGKVKIKWDIWI
jgi:hypothetical protein